MRTKKLTYVLPISEKEEILGGIFLATCTCAVIIDDYLIVGRSLTKPPITK